MTTAIFLYDTKSDFGTFKTGDDYFKFNGPLNELIPAITNARQQADEPTFRTLAVFASRV